MQQSIAACLQQSSKEISSLDAEILLSHVLQVNKAYLYAYPERCLQPWQNAHIQALVKRRRAKEPIAYLLGCREFWSLPLRVSRDTLIPRPETELLVEEALRLLPKRVSITVADLGTGTGAIALALAKERPHWQLLATDCSQAALQIARANAESLAINNIEFYWGDWCNALPKKPIDAIISNPPYIRKNDPCLSEDGVCFEPELALVSGIDGLAAIRAIINQAPDYLVPKGWLLFEHGYQQGEEVLSLLAQVGYHAYSNRLDFANHPRVTYGRW